MSPDSASAGPPVPAALIHHIDAVCDRFEAALAASGRPRIEDYLGDTGEPGRALLLRELILVEAYYRRQAGETPQPQDYRPRFPALDSTWLAGAVATGDTELPAPGPVATTGPLPAVPGYAILGELGRGGMGVVYRARQVSLNRPVALKMIRAGEYAGPAECARFRREAELVARLQHPHIVQVYEVGDHAGQPFCALELVEGGSLDRKLGGTPQPAEEAAGLAETLARAVHAAHQRGIVHRDLKPANVLLTADGTPKVTDFGLAKRLAVEAGASAGGCRTQSGAILGTPSYMAPEQAGGPAEAVSPATDVYALGAILYELLTGRPPFLGATPLDTLLLVRAQEPVPPRRLQPKVPRDLETICLKCLQKEPHRRYATAEALADDLRRFRQGEPIQARPAGLPERVVKWARRQPALAGSLAALLLAMGGGAAGGVWFTAELNAERDRARAEQQEADQQRQVAVTARAQAEGHRQRAEASYRAARQGLEKALKRVADDDRLKGGPLESLRRAVLEAEVAFHQEFIRLRGDEPDFQAERGRAYRRLAAVTRELASDAEAIDPARRAVAIFKDLVGRYPEVAPYRADLAESLHDLGLYYDATHRFPEAEQALGEALGLQQALAGRDLKVRSSLARSHHNLGGLYKKTRRPEAAEQALQAALALRQELVKEYPDDPLYQADLASSHHNLGVLYKDTGRVRESEKAYRAALTVLEVLAERHPDGANYQLLLGSAHHNLGILYKDTGRTKEAEEAYHAALAVRQKIADRHPAVTWYQEQLAVSHNDLGILYQDHGRREEAERAYQAALTVRRKLADQHPGMADYAVDVGGTQCNLGHVARENRQLEAALAWYAQAAPALEHVLAKHPGHERGRRYLRYVHTGRAMALAVANRDAEALDDWGGAIELAEERDRPWLRAQRMLSLARLKRHAEATAEAEEAARSPAVAGVILYHLARVYALSADAARHDPRLPEMESATRAEQYARQAVQLLARARQAGYLKGAAGGKVLQKTLDLQTLQARADYQELLDSLKEK